MKKRRKNTYFEELIYEIDFKTNTSRILTDDYAWYLNSFNNEIYYINASDNSICKISPLNAQKSILVNSSCDQLISLQNELFFIDKKNNHSLTSYNLTTNSLTRITSDFSKIIGAYNNDLYFSKKKDTESIYIFSPKKSEIRTIDFRQKNNKILFHYFKILTKRKIYIPLVSFMQNGGIYGIQLYKESSRYCCRTDTWCFILLLRNCKRTGAAAKTRRPSEETAGNTCKSIRDIPEGKNRTRPPEKTGIFPAGKKILP